MNLWAKRILIAFGVLGFVKFQMWRAKHRKPITAAELKQFEADENMFQDLEESTTTGRE